MGTIYGVAMTNERHPNDLPRQPSVPVVVAAVVGVVVPRHSNNITRNVNYSVSYCFRSTISH